jgi:hypothetical protein
MTGEQLGNPSTAGADHVDRGNNDHYNDDYLSWFALTVIIMLFKLATAQEVASELGQRLRARRLSLNQSQAETAARAGVSLGALRNLERSGLVTVEVMLRVASTLGLLQQLEPVFVTRAASIEQMEAASRVRRRAGRRKAEA